MNTLSSVKMVVDFKRLGSGKSVKVVDQRINMPFASEVMTELRKEIVKNNQIAYCYQQRDRQTKKWVSNKITH